MTNEEAIEILSDVGDINRCCAEDAEALDMAIKALEQQPCEDAISRADVKKYLSAPDANGDRVIYESDLDLLPSVTPKAEQKWIPCTKRLPGYGEEVLAFTKHGNLKVAFRDILTEPLWSTGFGKPLEIIAWMPLPEAYKAESEE